MKKKGIYIIAIGTLLATVLVNYNVHWYGDDFFYARFTKVDFNYFISRHIDHYMRANGRAIVHLLVTLFLGLNIHIWQIVNSMMLGGIVLFGTKSIEGKASINQQSNSANYSAFIMAVSIAFLDINMTRQSVYWLTGSFNYVYPILMLLVYWYLLSRKDHLQKSGWCLPVMAFLSAATVEQVSLMSFGLTLLMIIEQRVIRKQKPHRILILCLIAATLGMVSVVLAPSVFLRASIEDAPVNGFIALLKFNIKSQGSTFLFSKAMTPYLLFAMGSALGTIWLLRDKGIFKWRIVERGIAFYGGSAFLCWLWQMTSGSSITDYMNANPMQLLFFLFVGVGFIIVLLYAALLVYFNKAVTNRTLPFIALILGIGSQAMLLVSPVYGPRNLVPAVIMLVLYSAALMPQLNKMGISIIISGLLCFLLQMPWFLPVVVVAVLLIIPEDRKVIAITIGYSCIALIAVSVMKVSIEGYSVNARVYEDNLQLAQEFKMNSEKGTLIQKKLPIEMYGWVMPYHNPYYVPYYNLALDINRDFEIIWESEDQ